MIPFDDNLMISWIGQVGEEYAVKTALVDWQGNILSERTLTEVSGSRKTGFPRIAKVGDSLFLTYTKENEQKIVVEKFTL